MPRKKGQSIRCRPARTVLSPERAKEIRAKRLANLLPGGNNKAVRAAVEKRRAAGGRDILDRVQDLDIIEFAHAAGISFEGRPGQELCLRLMYGMPLPEGRIKVYVRRKCDGFVVEERMVSWLEYYTMLTGNEQIFEPGKPKRDAKICVGGRSGKTKGVVVVMTLYEASRNSWLNYIKPKETAYAGIIATKQQQARDLIQEHCLQTLEDSDLKGMIAESTQERIILTNGIGIRSFPCNTRAPRGYPYVFTVYDEAAFYYLEGAKSDVAVHSAMNPRRLQFPGSKHVEITTPAGKQGRFWNEFSKGAQVHNRLTVQAPTWLFRPELIDVNLEQFVEDYNENPDEFNREYGAEFDETIDDFLAEEDIQAGLRLPSDAPRDPSIQYGAGLDASGLSGNDRFGFAISGRNHATGEHVVSAVRSWAEKDPDPILADIKDLCRRYGAWQIFTDRYAKGWVHAALRKIGLEPVLAPTDIEVWTNYKQLLTAKRVAMPIDAELEQGLKDTKKAYSAASQKTRIVRQRSKKGHGDKAEAVAKAVWASSQNYFGSRPADTEDREREARRIREQQNYDPLRHGRC